ncbi:MAG: DUF6067 family protein [Akkermansia sp.]
MKTTILTLSLLGLAGFALNSPSLAQSADRRPIFEPDGPSDGNASGVSSSAQNLFEGTKVTASKSLPSNPPESAIDGQITPNNYWGAEGLPVWHQIDMGKNQSLSSIQIWPYWEDGRIYKYKVEGSKDGKSWKTLVDQSSNSISGTKEGSQYSFTPVEVRFIRTTFLDNSKGKQNGGHLVEIQGFAQPQKSNLNICAVPTNRRIPKHGSPDAEIATRKTIAETAWRGERVNAQVALWNDKPMSQVRFQAKPLKGPGGATIPVDASFVRFTLGGNKVYADIIEPNLPRVDLPAGTTRSVWLQMDIPAKATPGIYKGEILAKAQDSPAVKIPIALKVLPVAIPAPKNWKMHLDLWQHPESVARVHNVPSWSPEHFALLKPLMKRLADAGQKTITCSLIDEAWGGQTYDAWPAMIEWSMKPNGVMTYDYTNFDKWIDFMLNDVGINEQITCYTMIPWSNKLRYMDLATGDYKYIDIIPGQPGYEKVWGPFLTDLRKHAKEKGWLNRICIGIDERPDSAVKAAHTLVQKYAPEFKIGSAVNSPTQTTSEMYNLSPVFGHSNTVMGNILAKRKAEGKKTTYYVCVQPNKPNTFTVSPLAESEWLGIFTAANHFDGFLRWAYNSWGRDSIQDSSFGNWPAGDCFLVYPGNRSSLRFEKLRDGIEDFEKIELLRQYAKTSKASPALKKAVADMDKTLLELFTVPRGSGTEHEDDVNKANAAILKAAMEIR